MRKAGIDKGKDRSYMVRLFVGLSLSNSSSIIEPYNLISLYLLMGFFKGYIIIRISTSLETAALPRINKNIVKLVITILSVPPEMIRSQ